jgi:hypothetical protein
MANRPPVESPTAVDFVPECIDEARRAPYERASMELGWWKRDDDGKKYQIHLEMFGGKLRWRCQRQRAERWQDYGPPSDEDWTMAVKLAEHRYYRRLITKQVVELVRRRGVDG